MQDENNRSGTRWALILLSLALLLWLFKHGLVSSLPVEARAYRTDDLLMLNLADGLINRNWLGPYRGATLMKGAFFPLFLSWTIRFGPSYLASLDALNMLACVFFVSQVRSIFRDKRLLFFLFIFLLFEPCTYSRMTFQRVYRAGITEAQVLFLFGSWIGLYLSVRRCIESGDWRGTHRDLARSLTASLALWAMWNAREESFWILPFVLTATAVIAGLLICALRRRPEARTRIVVRLLCCLLPLAFLPCGNAWLRRENEKNYGASVRLEEVDGAFAAALKTIYSARGEEEIPWVTISRTQMELLYDASASLRQIRPELDAALDRYSSNDRRPEEAEVEDGWFFWALKYAAYESGAADTLPKSQAFWRQVRMELEAALDAPGSPLVRRPVMPSALMSPWRSTYTAQLPRTFFRALRYLVTYQEVGPRIEASGKSSASVSRCFEIYTNNQVVYSEANDAAQRLIHEGIEARLLRVIRLYRAVNPAAFLLGAAVFLLLLFLCFFRGMKEAGPCLLVTAGMFLSAFLLLAGVSYTDLTAFPAIGYFYMSGAYPLLLAAEWIAILYAADLLLGRRRSAKARSAVVLRGGKAEAGD